MSLWLCREHGVYGPEGACPKCGKAGTYFFVTVPRLNELATLKDGWLDGEGKAITKTALEKAEELLNPRVYPTPEGGVSIETDEYDVIVAPDGEVHVVWETEEVE